MSERVDQPCIVVNKRRGPLEIGDYGDGPRYRMMGNAVTVNVLEWIGRRIMEAQK